MRQIYRILSLLFLAFPFQTTYARSDNDSVIVFRGHHPASHFISTQTYVLADSTGELTINDIAHIDKFTPNRVKVPNYGVSHSTYWIRFTILNQSEYESFSFEVENPLLTSVVLFEQKGGRWLRRAITKDDPFSVRGNSNQNAEFLLRQPIGSVATYFLSISGNTQLLVPMKIGTIEAVANINLNRDLLSAIYFGIMLVMFFYNLFVFISVKDRSYLYYIFYIICVTLVQLNITGLGFKYLWPSYPKFEQASVFLFPSFTAFTSIAFFRRFLYTKRYAKKAQHVFWVFVAAYVFTIVNAFTGDKLLSYNLLNYNALPLALFMIGLATYILIRYKYRPALFFLIAWTVFLISIVLFVLKDMGVLPYNLFTVSTIQIGSAIEVVLLSIALADRINTLKKEKEVSQAQALRISQENERIIREQNVMLEAKVNERTVELKQSNEELAKTLQDLTEKETQLVESEKMASLGQLTAGIAHEINNPINFVTSNVNPLKRDVTILVDMIAQIEELTMEEVSVDEKKKRIESLKNDMDYDYLKTEIDYLLKGIGEGASRTAEIVKGLRVFSRLDEDDLKKADINEGLDSTVVIVNHLLNGTIEVVRNYSGIPLVECYPGKLNQVFLNMMSNAIHAIHKKWQGQPGGRLELSTRNDETSVWISIKDNGTGMDENTKKKLFEPFFTTKDVGEGTGLGLSIAYNTVKRHSGIIEVHSEEGQGTEFVINIPINQ